MFCDSAVVRPEGSSLSDLNRSSRSTTGRLVSEKAVGIGMAEVVPDMAVLGCNF